MAGFLDALHDETDGHDAAVFTESRLAAQHDRILRRIDPAGRSGHVISFPIHHAARHIETAPGFAARRWVAAAAVAGLVAGLLLGRVADRSLWTTTPGLTPATAQSLMARQTAAAVRPGSASADDGFVSVDLSDLDAIGADHTVVLQAYRRPHAARPGSRDPRFSLTPGKVYSPRLPARARGPRSVVQETAARRPDIAQGL